MVNSFYLWVICKEFNDLLCVFCMTLNTERKCFKSL